MNPAAVFKRPASSEWTLERIAQMSAEDIRQLRENAVRLNEAAVAALCTQALEQAGPVRSGSRKRAVYPTRALRLVARTKAFEMRGVGLFDPKTSWSGVRKLDGSVVMVLWADHVESADGGCRYLLWAPNVEGSRPWSDTEAGKERHDHCKRAMELGQAEGMLLYGVCLEGVMPEQRARAVRGVDPDTVIRFQVEGVGREFWAKWGKERPAGSVLNG